MKVNKLITILLIFVSLVSTQVVPTCWFRVKSALTNKCLRFNNWQVWQSSCGEDDNYYWKATNSHEGTFNVWTKVTSNALWDLGGGATYNGGNLMIYSPHGGDNQRYYFQYLNDGTWRMWNKRAWKCLDVPGGTSNDVYMQQWDCQDGNWNQKFKLECDHSSRPVSGAPHNCNWLRFVFPQSRCIRNNNGQLLQSNCQLQNPFSYSFYKNTDGTYSIYSKTDITRA
jgi:hypothetical protein